MNEIILPLSNIDHVSLWGANSENIELLKTKFPKLRIVVRGDELRALGVDKDLEAMKSKVEELIALLDKKQHLTKHDVETVLGLPWTDVIDTHTDNTINNQSTNNSEIILYGNNGLIIKARSKNQQRLVDANVKNDIVFAIGPAGTGKTYTAVALAVKALKNKTVKRIVLTRPAVEAGENLGFLPGDLKEKIDPYLRPLYDALNDMLPQDKLKAFIETGIIEIAPLAFMRGRTLDNAFVILDEAQNTTDLQMKMFLTRMGPSAKFIITGDITQVDLPKTQHSGLIKALDVLKDIKGIDMIFLDGNDVIRHKLVRKILEAYGDISK